MSGTTASEGKRKAAKQKRDASSDLPSALGAATQIPRIAEQDASEAETEEEAQEEPRNESFDLFRAHAAAMQILPTRELRIEFREWTRKISLAVFTGRGKSTYTNYGLALLGDDDPKPSVLTVAMIENWLRTQLLALGSDEGDDTSDDPERQAVTQCYQKLFEKLNIPMCWTSGSNKKKISQGTTSAPS